MQQSKDTFMAAMRPLALTVLLAILVLATSKQLKLNWLPDAAVVITFTAIYAFYVRSQMLGGVMFGAWGREAIECVMESVLHLLLLPISIFESGYSNMNKNFWSQFGYGVTFAVLGTLLTAFLLAFLIIQTGPNGWKWHPIDDFRAALCYSAFIADLDPVATLSAFAALEVDLERDKCGCFFCEARLNC